MAVGRAGRGPLQGRPGQYQEDGTCGIVRETIGGIISKDGGVCERIVGYGEGLCGGVATESKYKG